MPSFACDPPTLAARCPLLWIESVIGEVADRATIFTICDASVASRLKFHLCDFCHGRSIFAECLNECGFSVWNIARLQQDGG
jgi:hypothetical protein